LSGDKVISADKMMNKAKGPVWHKKQKEKGIIPKGLRGIDRQATWGKSNADGWVYGHGTFTVTSHKHPVLGCFMWMRNSANEAKRLWLETFHVKEQIDYAAMDSKASGSCIHVGSIPTSGTNDIKGLTILVNPFFSAEIMDCARNCARLSF
jgi:hypothetical protein